VRAEGRGELLPRGVPQVDEAALPPFLRDAPLDAEPLTPADEAALAEGRAAIARGDVVSLDALRVELDL
jgi:hypothetical protein